jgi:hypothetical protein
MQDSLKCCNCTSWVALSTQHDFATAKKYIGASCQLHTPIQSRGLRKRGAIPPLSQCIRISALRVAFTTLYHLKKYTRFFYEGNSESKVPYFFYLNGGKWRQEKHKDIFVHESSI